MRIMLSVVIAAAILWLTGAYKAVRMAPATMAQVDATLSAAIKLLK